MNRLRKDTQKPELDDLRLEVSYMPKEGCVTHPSFGGMSGEKHEDKLAKANVEQLVRKLICVMPIQIAHAVMPILSLRMKRSQS